ncbi:XF1762 family protein [Streptomyces olivaceus]
MNTALLHLVPVRSRQAKDFVRTWHRHHPPPAGQIFAVGAADETGILRAVAIVGRPVARHLDDGATLEVTRTASDGARNANSLLYGAAWRAAKALGYRRMVTYTQDGESGASLRGAGWRVIASRPPRAGWHTASRPRADHGNNHVTRLLWQAPADHRAGDQQAPCTAPLASPNPSE